jgi:hypothetical protein
LETCLHRQSEARNKSRVIVSEADKPHFYRELRLWILELALQLS